MDILERRAITEIPAELGLKLLLLRVARVMAMAVAFTVVLSAAAPAAVTILVDTASDESTSNTCTLRDAINITQGTPLQGNSCRPEGRQSASGTLTYFIGFTIGLTDTIELKSTLPTIARGNVIITGPTSSPGITIGGGDAVVGFQVNSGATLTIKNLTIAHCRGTNAGAGISNAGILNVTNSTFFGNSDPTGGAGILNDMGSLTVTNSAFVKNKAGHGAGILNVQGTLTVANSRFLSNVVDQSGGGITINRGSTVTVTDSTFSGNHAGTVGGGIASHGASTLTIVNSIFSGNGAVQDGGGITSDAHGMLTVTNTTISDNRADRGGGISNGGTLTVTNCTFSRNSSRYGGGIAHAGTPTGGPLTVTNTTFFGNSGSLSGDSIENKGSASLKGTILVGTLGTTGTGNCFASVPITDAGYNIANDASCTFTATGSRNSTNPKLGVLKINGGPTQTIALLPGSPAIDAIPVVSCTDQASPTSRLITSDQRGMPRPGVRLPPLATIPQTFPTVLPTPTLRPKTGCDIGAYEYQSFGGRPIKCALAVRSALTAHFHSLDEAARALMFTSGQSLQAAIGAYCDPSQ